MPRYQDMHQPTLPAWQDRAAQAMAQIAAKNDIELRSAHLKAQVQARVDLAQARIDRDIQAQIDEIKALCAPIDDDDDFRGNIIISLGDAIRRAYYLHCRALGDDAMVAQDKANKARANFMLCQNR